MREKDKGADMDRINISHLKPCSQANGPGNRFVIWLQGCNIGCKDCFNKHTWSFAPNKLFTVQELFDEVMKQKDKITGVTYSGGEPFLQAELLTELSAKFQNHGLSVVCFSGFTIEFLQSNKAPKGARQLLQQIDLLIDGPYKAERKTDNLPLRGSANQRLIFLTGRYSINDIDDIPRFEINVSQGKITSTGFMDRQEEDLLFKVFGLEVK